MLNISGSPDPQRTTGLYTGRVMRELVTRAGVAVLALVFVLGVAIGCDDEGGGGDGEVVPAGKCLQAGEAICDAACGCNPNPADPRCFYFVGPAVVEYEDIDECLDFEPFLMCDAKDGEVDMQACIGALSAPECVELDYKFYLVRPIECTE